MSAREVTILLVDDHAVVRAGFRRLLEQTPGIRVVTEAASGDEAYRVFGECQPDVAVMDFIPPRDAPMHRCMAAHSSSAWR